MEYSFEEKLYLTFGCWWRGRKSCSKWCGDAKWEGCVTHVVGAWIFWFPFILWGRDFFLKTLHYKFCAFLMQNGGEAVQLILDSCGWRELKGNIEVGARYGEEGLLLSVPDIRTDWNQLSCIKLWLDCGLTVFLLFKTILPAVLCYVRLFLWTYISNISSGM